MDVTNKPEPGCTQPAGRQTFSWWKLVINHMDAWIAAFIASVAALVVHQQLTLHFLLLAVALAAGYGLAFAINDYYDAPADALAPAKQGRNPFVATPIPAAAFKRTLFWVSVPLAIIFSSFGWSAVPFILLSLVIGFGYSKPPLRFKDRPGIDLLVHALFVQTYPYAVTVWFTGRGWLALDGMIMTITFLASSTAQLEQQVRDYDTDLLAGSQTFTTCYGVQLTHKLLLVGTFLLGLVAAGVVYFRLAPPVLWPIAFISAPALLHRFVRPVLAPRSEKLVQISVVVGLIYTMVSLIFITIQGE